MRFLENLRLRDRLVLAFVILSLVAVATSTLVVERVLEEEVDAFLVADLRADAAFAEAAVVDFVRDEGRVTPPFLRRLERALATRGRELALLDADGDPITGADWRAGAAPGTVAAAPVRLGAPPLGTVLVRDATGTVGRVERLDQRLDDSLLRVGLIALLVATVVAVVGAVLLAERLTRPLRRLARELREFDQGTLSVVPVGGPREVTEVARAYNRLARRLREEERYRREAAASVAHELRTPLSGVLTRLEALQDGILAPDRENLAAVWADADRLRRLVEDAEHLREAEGEALRLDRAPLALDELVAERVEALRGRFEAAGVELDADLEPAMAFGDRARLEQVVDHLLTNACSYTPASGTAVVRTAEANGSVLLAVADTGVGVRAQDLPHLFDAFWRAESSRARATGGSGLGLSVVRELVAAHDGRITVQSRVGTGTTVTVLLPRA